ncbi:normal mucosa of esophagus-specific gene 1 protein-like [Littorina saxatilis]|uniref:Uncharacterized protein n=1 Tax=Littorina saxatilis TaxID=31220 RepID=A0AAN9B0A6_9CAEN
MADPAPSGPPPKRKPAKTFGFGINALKTHPELIPVVVVVSVAVGGCMAFMGYSLLKKPDIEFVRRHGNIPSAWESVKPDEKRKLRVVKPELYKPIPEVEQLKRDIGSYKS